MTAVGGSRFGTVVRVKWSQAAGATVVVFGAAAVAAGGRGEWITGDPAHLVAPLTDAQRHWMLIAAAALALCSLIGLAGAARWVAVVAWVHAGAAVLVTVLGVNDSIGPTAHASGAALGWGAWVALGGIVVAMVGLMAMLRHDLDDAPVPEPARRQRRPAKRPPAKTTAANKAPANKAPAQRVPAKSAGGRAATGSRR